MPRESVNGIHIKFALICGFVWASCADYAMRLLQLMRPVLRRPEVVLLVPYDQLVAQVRAMCLAVGGHSGSASSEFFPKPHSVGASASAPLPGIGEASDGGLVTIGPSRAFPAAGRGVFTRVAVQGAGVVVALYPGTYTPPPPPAAVPLDGLSAVEVCPPDPANGYVLNLEMGGYLDAQAVAGPCGGAGGSAAPGTGTGTGTGLGRPGAGAGGGNLDLPPAYSAHLVNHASRVAPNVTAMCFLWRDVVRPFGPASVGDGGRGGALPVAGPEVACSGGALTAAAGAVNAFATPGSPWFATDAELVCMPIPGPVDAADAVAKGLAGAAFVSTCPMPPGTELLLDYQLRGPPYPPWAVPWYAPALAR
jgi:hypothetical protein